MGTQWLWLSRITKIFSVVLVAVADTNYRFVYTDIGSCGDDSDSTIFKRSALWTSIQTIVQWDTSFGNSRCKCTILLCRRGWICAKHKYTFPLLLDLTWVLKKSVPLSLVQKHEGMRNVLWEFWTLNGELFRDRLMLCWLCSGYC